MSPIFFFFVNFILVSCYSQGITSKYDKLHNIHYSTPRAILARAIRSPQNKVGLEATDTHVRVDGQANLYNSNKGHSLDGQGFYQRNFHNLPKNEYGGSLTYSKPNEYFVKGSMGGMDQSKFLRGDAGVDMYRSNNGRTSLTGSGYYQRNFNFGPKQDYGGMLTLKHKF